MTSHQTVSPDRLLKLSAFFLILLVALISRTGRTQDDTPEALFRRGALQFEQGRYVLARLDFSQVAELYSDSPWAPAAVMMLAKSYFAMGDINEARNIALHLQSDYKQSRYAGWAPYLIAACDFRNGDAQEALDGLASLAAVTIDDNLRLRSLAAIRDTIQPLTGESAVATALESAGIPSDALEGLPSQGAIADLTETTLMGSQGAVWQDRDTIRVGLLAPLTGMNADLGAQLLNGVESVLNVRGEIHGKKVELLIENTESDPVTAILKTRILIKEGVIAIIGPVLSEESFGPAAIADEYGIPFLAPTTTDPEFTHLGRFVYQLNFNPEVQARALADLAAGILGLKTYAVIASDDPWGEAVASAFTEQMTEYDGIHIHTGFYNVDEPSDNHDLLMRIRDRAPDSASVIDSVVVLNPGSAFPDTLFVRQNETVRGEQMLGPVNSIDCIIISATSEHAALIASQLMEYHINTVILGDNGWWSNEQAIRLGSQYVDGSFVVAPAGQLSGGDGLTPQAGGMIGDLAARIPVMRGSDAARLLIHCFENGADTPLALAEMLDHITNLRGIASRITIDPENRMNKAVDFIRILDGTYERVDISRAEQLRDDVRVRFFQLRMEQNDQDFQE